MSTNDPAREVLGKKYDTISMPDGTPIHLKFISIDPDLARLYLGLNTHNRPVSQVRVDYYAKEIANEAWRVIHQGIAFSDDGILIDGQHRLKAIIQAGIPCIMLVSVGWPMRAQSVVDIQRMRTDGDRLSLLSNRAITNRSIAILRSALRGPYAHRGASKVPIDILDEAMTLAKDAIARSIISQRAVARADVSGVLVRVRLVGHDDLADNFMNELQKEVCDDESKVSAFRLRSWLVASQQKGGGAVMKIETYRRTQSAVRAFSTGQALGAVKQTTVDLWPLTGRLRELSEIIYPVSE